MNRCAFIAALGGAGVWPLAGHAQGTERTRRVGMLVPWPENYPVARTYMTAFAHALDRLGWVERKNIRIDYRFAAGDPTLFKTYAAEPVGLSPDAILAGTNPAVEALQQQTRTIPIVFVFVSDAVGRGLVQSLARPGGSITGFSADDPPIMGKWVQVLKEIAPSVTRVAVIFSPERSSAALLNRAIAAAASSLGVTVTFAAVHDDAGIEPAVAAQAREPGGGLIDVPSPFIQTYDNVIIAAATRHGLPLIGLPSLVRAGGLISYWFDPVDVYAQAASYIDRIQFGGTPGSAADEILPDHQPQDC